MCLPPYVGAKFSTTEFTIDAHKLLFELYASNSCSVESVDFQPSELFLNKHGMLLLAWFYVSVLVFTLAVACTSVFSSYVLSFDLLCDLL